MDYTEFKCLQLLLVNVLDSLEQDMVNLVFLLVLRKGHILVADFNNRHIQVFNMDGTFVQVIDCNGEYPTYVAVDNFGNIHVTYHNQLIVQVFLPDGITKIHIYSSNFQNPQGIAIDEGYCFITTQSPNYLHVLDPTGQVNVIGDLWGVALDRQGYVYVAKY